MKHNSRKKRNDTYTNRNDIYTSPVTIVIAGILGILLGVWFIFMQADNEPITRDEALCFDGTFLEYEASDNYRCIVFENDECYFVHAHTEKPEFAKKMAGIKQGTKLYLCINPNNDYVIEVKTDTELLLDFESSQIAIQKYDRWYSMIGIVMILLGCFLFLYLAASTKHKKAEAQKRESKMHNCNTAKNDPVLRQSDNSRKIKILLNASADNYKIIYQRTKLTNELVINGNVYDEKKGLIEFEHALSARIDGHLIEAGLDENSHSYIKFDGRIIKEKMRLI